MGNNKLLKISIAVLVVINIVTLSYLWLNIPERHGPPHGNDVFAYLCNELKFDEQQRRQYEDLRNEHHSAVEHIQQRATYFREQFFDLLHSSADSMQVRALSDSIANCQEQIEQVTFYHFKKVRAICNPEQQKRFDEVIQDALRMMGRQQQGPPPPR